MFRANAGFLRACLCRRINLLHTHPGGGSGAEEESIRQSIEEIRREAQVLFSRTSSAANEIQAGDASHPSPPPSTAPPTTEQATPAPTQLDPVIAEYPPSNRNLAGHTRRVQQVIAEEVQEVVLGRRRSHRRLDSSHAGAADAPVRASYEGPQTHEQRQEQALARMIVSAFYQRWTIECLRKYKIGYVETIFSANNALGGILFSTASSSCRTQVTSNCA